MCSRTSILHLQRENSGSSYIEEAERRSCRNWAVEEHTLFSPKMEALTKEILLLHSVNPNILREKSVSFCGSLQAQESFSRLCARQDTSTDFSHCMLGFTPIRYRTQPQIVRQRKRIGVKHIFIQESPFGVFVCSAPATADRCS